MIRYRKEEGGGQKMVEKVIDTGIEEVGPTYCVRRLREMEG